MFDNLHIVTFHMMTFTKQEEGRWPGCLVDVCVCVCVCVCVSVSVCVSVFEKRGERGWERRLSTVSTDGGYMHL